jgi:hypothetical protein
MLLADVRSIKLGATPIIAVHVGAVKVWPVFVPDFHGRFQVQPSSLELRLNMDGPRPGDGEYTAEVAAYSSSIPHPDLPLGDTSSAGAGRFNFTDGLSTFAPSLRATSAEAVAAWAGRRISFTVAQGQISGVQVLP